MATTSDSITTNYVDLALSADGDLLFSSDGDLILATDNKTSLIQRFRMRFNIWATEWVYNIDYGFPFFSYIGKPVNKSAIDAEFKRQILLEADIERISSFSSVYDKANRSYACMFEVITSENTTEALAYYLNDSYEYSVPSTNIGTCQIIEDAVIYGNKLYKLINYDMIAGAYSTWIRDTIPLTSGYGASGYGSSYGE